MIDFEQLAQESALYPWLDSDCMGDTFAETFWDDLIYTNEPDED